MTLFLFKATLVLLLGLLAVSAGRHARASVRHLILASTFAILLLMPIATYLLPAMTIALPQSIDAITNDATSRTQILPLPSTVLYEARSVEARDFAETNWRELLRASTLGKMISPSTAIGSIWALVVTVLAFSLVISLVRLRQLRRHGLPWLQARSLVDALASRAGINRPIDVLIHEEVAAPMTCGFVRPAIVMPSDVSSWQDGAVRRALVHELEHVRRHDWWVYLISRAVCIIYWFHPLVWIAHRQLCLAAEHACDDAVLECDESTQYAEQLVGLARKMGTNAHPALAMAMRSDLSARVSALLDEHRARGRAGVVGACGIVVAAALLVMTVAPLDIIAASLGPAVEQSTEHPRRASFLDRALLEAADEGDAAEVDELLKNGANVNAVIIGDGTPLIAAAREGHVQIATLLLDRGADPNLGVVGDGNALTMAAREGHLELVTLLLNRGADVNLGVRGDGNALIMAAREGYATIVQVLLEHGARIDEVVESDENALIQASGEGQLEVVKLLVARGADVNARVFAEPAYERPNGEWRTPLNMALRSGHREVAEFLRASGATAQ